MVSSSLLVGLASVASLIHGLPLRSADDLTHDSSNVLTSRSPEPRFKNPFDVGDFLKSLDTKIPNNQDIQNWIDQAVTKGAIGGDDDGDSDDDDDDDDVDDDNDDDDDDDDDDDNDNDRKEGHQDLPKKGNMIKPTPSVPARQSTPTGSQTAHAVASSTPSPSSIPSLHRDETLASSPTVFYFSSTTPISATPTSTPVVMYKIITA